MSSPPRSSVNVLFFGDAHSGKSTIVGSLLSLTSSLKPDFVAQREKEAIENGNPASKYARLVDRNSSSENHSLKPTFHKCDVPSSFSCSSLTLIDTPGLTKSLSQTAETFFAGDIGVFVVSAASTSALSSSSSSSSSPSPSSSSSSSSSSTSSSSSSLSSPSSSSFALSPVSVDLLLTAFTLGVKYLVICVSRISSSSSSSSSFASISEACSKHAIKIGFKSDHVVSVPVDALAEDNLTTKSTTMTWHKGATLLGGIDSLSRLLPSQAGLSDRPLRFPVTKVHIGKNSKNHIDSNSNTENVIVTGKIESGQIKPGNTVTISGKRLLTGVVRSIEVFGLPVESASAGSYVGLCISVSPSIANDQTRLITAGAVIGPSSSSLSSSSSPSPSPASSSSVLPAYSFDAQLVVVDHACLMTGYSPTLVIHSSSVPVRVSKLLSLINKKTGQSIDDNPTSFKTGDVGVVRLTPLSSVVVEPYSGVSSVAASLGRFVLRSGGVTVAIGVVRQVTKINVTATKNASSNTPESELITTTSQAPSTSSSSSSSSPSSSLSASASGLDLTLLYRAIVSVNGEQRKAIQAAQAKKKTKTNANTTENANANANANATTKG